MEDIVRKTVLTAKKTAPNDWYKQRSIIGELIETLAKNTPEAFHKQVFLDGRLVIIMFKFAGDIYFWWDEIIEGGVIECSGFERMIGDPVDGKIQAEIMWSSDPTTKEPLIPGLPIYFE